MKATFNNKDSKNFSFRQYLTLKYDGLFTKDTPSQKDIKVLSSEIHQTPRGEKRTALERERNRLISKYNSVMNYWRRLQ